MGVLMMSAKLITPARCLVACLLLSIMAWHGPPRVTHASSGPLLVVVGPSFPGTDIGLGELKTSFRGRVVFVRGTRLIPLNHALGSALRVAFDRVALGLEPAAVGRFWIDQRIRDGGKPPTTAPTLDLALRAVATLPGAITYATRSDVQQHQRLKVLTVDGKAADDPGYALRE